MATIAKTPKDRLLRLYLDESGDHTWSASDDPGRRYLGLVGVAFSVSAYEPFQVEFEALKRKHFPGDLDEPVVLHRVDLVRKTGRFVALRDSVACEAFDRELLDVIGRAAFWTVAVVLDKRSHQAKLYRGLTHPYHYCLNAVLERYCGRMRFFGAMRGDVMVEGRGGVEDRELKKEFRYFAEHGSRYTRPGDLATLTSKEIKIREKKADVCGLQLADLLARPLTRDVLRHENRTEAAGAPFDDRLLAVVEPKYNKQLYSGQVSGYGRILLT